MFHFKVFLLISLISAIINAKYDDFDCTNYAAIDCLYDCETQICASNGKCEQWFCNGCNLNIANCIAKENHERQWNIVPNGKCECPTRCQNIYKPVCGYYDGTYRLFSSKCVLDRISCETYTDWEKVDIEECYPIYEPSECPLACTKEYFPICAYNGKKFKEFANNCLFNLGNCQESNIWGAFIIGGCPDCYNYYT